MTEEVEDVVRVVAVIPCHNEAQNVADVVFVANKLIGLVIVADDSSDDATRDEAEGAGAAYVVRHFGKRGAGANTQTGVDVALALDCDIIVTLDGDGQHDPKEILGVVEPLVQGVADVVVGSRFIKGHGGTIPRYRSFGIKVITWLYNVGSQQKLTDAQCCFRAYSRESLEKIGITETGFSFSIETLVKARRLGLRIVEVPVNVLYHKQFSQNSSLNPIRHGLGVALGVVKWRILSSIRARGIDRQA